MNRSERRQATPRPSQTDLKARAARRGLIIYASLIVLAIGAIVTVSLVVRNGGGLQSASNAPDFAAISVGQSAPAFSVATTNGPFDSSKVAGKPILLEAFATWCTHCQREVPALNALYAKYKDKANVVGVSASIYAMDSATPESQADVVAFMQKFGVHYPIAFDPNLDVAHKYLQGGFPTIVLVGGDGKILAIGSGEIEAKQLQKALDAAIAGKPVDPTFGQKKT
jgi:thiol-disulfide isomerase/thioredoxin